jgi:ABC-2 type transport system permease protein
VASNATAASGPLEPIPGPSIFGSDGKRFWKLVWLNAVAEFKLMYVGSALGSVLGYLWALARPLLTFAIIYIVFSQVLKIGATIPYYAAFLLFNLTLFAFFGETVGRAIQAFVANEGVLRKTQFPRAVVPLSIVLTGIFTFGLNLIAVFAIILGVGTPPLETWLLLPVLWIFVLALTTAFSVLFSTLFVRFRDVNQIWLVLSTMLFYASPIMYPVEQVPSDFHWMLILNPLAPIFTQARVWAVDPSAPTALEATGNIWGLLGPALIFVAICAYATVLMARRARTMAEDL